MSDQLSMWSLMTCEASRNATSSPVSGDGHTPCVLRGGPMTGPSGPDHHHASRSALPVPGQDVTMPATSPPTLPHLSLPADRLSCSVSKSPARLYSERLQSALEDRLKARLPLNGLGSMIYSSVWKPHTTPAGRQISRLRASARRTSDSDAFSERCGWPTATTRDHKDGPECLNVPTNALLGRVVWLAGWPTCTIDSKEWSDDAVTRYANGHRGTHGLDLGAAVKLTSLARLTARGQLLTGSTAAMSAGGQLNPAHSRWLMGYPPEWDDCAVTAMPSSRKRQQSL
jgi:hypothetical protein